MKEIWKPIFAGAYEVSNKGRVRRGGKILKPLLAPQGYEKVHICFAGARQQKYIHDLVAFAFIGSRCRGEQVNHKDGVKRNNAPSNLEYLSAAENSRHSVRLGLSPIGERHYKARLTNTDVVQIRRHYRSNSVELGRLYGVSDRTIRHVVERKTWKHL